MHTKDMLAEALRGAGLDEMAVQAAAGYYHDYLSPLTFPEMQLQADLQEAHRRAPSNDQRVAIGLLIGQHIAGHFDASAAEAEEWSRTPEGQEMNVALITRWSGGR